MRPASIFSNIQLSNFRALEEPDTFAIIGATIAENFDVEMPEGTIGSSILDKLQ